MNVTLTPDMQALVERQIQKGAFANPEEVVVASLKLLQVQEELLADLRNEVNRGVVEADEGNLVPATTAGEILKRLRNGRQ